MIAVWIVWARKGVRGRGSRISKYENGFGFDGLVGHSIAFHFYRNECKRVWQNETAVSWPQGMFTHDFNPLKLDRSFLMLYLL